MTRDQDTLQQQRSSILSRVRLVIYGISSKLEDQAQIKKIETRGQGKKTILLSATATNALSILLILCGVSSSTRKESLWS